MCPPLYYGVEYVINPWMEGQVHHTDNRLAREQWASLHAILGGLAEVALLPAVSGLPDLVFTANAALIHQKTAVLSNFRCPERQPEAPHNSTWFSQNGYEVFHLPPDISFEGAGDALFDRALPLLWLGHGYRSDIRVQPHLARATGKEVQPLRLCDPRFYHLDTCFCPLEDGHLLYFPAAFDQQGNAAIEARVPASKRLGLAENDAIHFACNAINVGSSIVLNDASVETADWLKSRGFTTLKTDLREFIKAGGAAKCLSLRLHEH
jgi:N-dimethylarginine dimethylaminohydrolase